jgi:hypothetical protein
MWYCECSLACPSLPLWINTEVDTVFIDFLDLKWRDENPEDYEERKFLHVAEQAPQIFEAIRVLEIRNIPVIADPGIWFTITVPGGVLRQDPREHRFLTRDVDRIMPSLVRFPFLEVLCLTVQHEAYLRLTQHMKDGLVNEIKRWLANNSGHSISRHLATIHIRSYVGLSSEPLSLDDSLGIKLSTFTPENP